MIIIESVFITRDRTMVEEMKYFVAQMAINSLSTVGT